MKYGIHFTILMGIVCSPFFAHGASWINNSGNMVASGDVVQNTGFTGSGYSSIKVEAPNSANFNKNGDPVDNLGFVVSGTIDIQGDFLHNSGLVADGSGGFGVMGDNTYMTASDLKVGGEIIMGDGSNSNQLTLNIDKISADKLTTNTGSKLVLNPSYANSPTMNITTDANIADGIYMGNGAVGAESIHVNSDAAGNVYTINADGYVNIGQLGAAPNVNSVGAIVSGGFINSELGTLVINSKKDINVAGNVAGNNKLTADDYINIAGNVSGNNKLDAGENININGNVSGISDFYADKNINITGNASGTGALVAGDSINIGNNLGTGIDISAKHVTIGGDVAGGVHLGLNDTDSNGYHTSFDRMDVNVTGTYYFDNDSFLQLVLNQDVADSDGNSEYNADSDDALIYVGGFDASGVTRDPNIDDMNSTPNIEIIVDNIMDELRKIKMLESTTEITDLGALNLVGIWFYDTASGTRLFQEAGLTLGGSNNNIIFLNVATMRSIAGMVALVPKYAGPTGNDMQMALAIDDLIIKRLGDDRIDGHYSSLMRLLFPKGDIYNKMMINGGVNDDALDVMIADGIGYETDATYIRAMNYVRQFALSDVDTLNRTMALSSRLLRSGVTDHLMDDYIWQRYHNKGVAWGDFTLNSPDGGGTILSFSGGADWQFGNKWMLGATLGYNHLNVGDTSGSTFSFGAYGAWDVTSWGRAYGAANLAFHSIDIESYSPLTGHLDADITTTDATIELGLLHRLFSTYLTGRAYVYMGNFGGYDLTKTVKSGENFMDIKYDDSFVVTPGYEISLGKDIFMGLWAFVRPSVKFGIEYDLLERETDFQFKFSESSIYRNWQGSGADSRLWMRYGIQAEFAISQGANLVAGYEILKNGDFKSNSFKLSGSVRF